MIDSSVQCLFLLRSNLYAKNPGLSFLFTRKSSSLDPLIERLSR